MSIFLSIKEASMPIFVDAYLVDAGRLLFCSLWGGETAVQELFARLTLPEAELGLREITLLNPESQAVLEEIEIRNAADLAKITSKTPSTTVLGALSHAWLYDPLLKQQQSGRSERCLLMRKPKEGNLDRQAISGEVWSTIQELSKIPLMDEWKAPIMNALTENQWLQFISGLGVEGIKIRLPEEEFTQKVQQLLRSGQLSLSSQPPEAPKTTEETGTTNKPEVTPCTFVQGALF